VFFETISDLQKIESFRIKNRIATIGPQQSTMASVIMSSDVRHQVHAFIDKSAGPDVTQGRLKGETVFYFHRKIRQFMWATNEQMLEQIEMWRSLGKFRSLEYNCETKKIKGKDYYIMVVQFSDGNELGMDPFGLGGFDDQTYVVDGLIYAFTRKENRDMCHEYLNRPMTKNSAKRPKAESDIENLKLNTTCLVCAKRGVFKTCAKCHNDCYCSKECQKADWSRHKAKHHA